MTSTPSIILRVAAAVALNAITFTAAQAQQWGGGEQGMNGGSIISVQIDHSHDVVGININNDHQTTGIGMVGIDINNDHQTTGGMISVNINNEY